MKITKRAIVITVAALMVLAAAVGGTVYYLANAASIPDTIVSGGNDCKLGRYNLPQKGLSGLQILLERTPDLPKQFNVAYFEADVDKKGNVKSFTLSLDTFDEQGNFSGLASYGYQDKILSYNPPTPDNLALVRTPNANSELNYLDEQLKKIPLVKQIEQSGFDHYCVRYQPFTLIEAGTPIFDARTGNAIPVLSEEDYNAGAGGTSDGKTNVVFRLYSGQSIASGQQYLYVFTPIDPDAAVGDQLAMMQCDYYIDNGRLKLTRNYGQDWFDAGLSEEDLAETLAFYRNALSLPPESLFIPADASLPIAYFYGEDPKLNYSSDNGATWNTTAFPTEETFGRPITKRVVGFASEQFGYAALGTDWSMGAGEQKFCYFTTDGGKSWAQKALPLNLSSRTLLDMAMADEKNGVVALDAGMDVYFPIFYATQDTAQSWQEIALPYDAVPEEVQYLTDIENLQFTDGQYFLTLGQGDSGTKKVTFTAETLDGPWRYEKTEEKPIHTVG